MTLHINTAEWLAQQYVPGFSARHLPVVSPQSFRAYGYDAARSLNGKFVEDRRPGICKNHEIALMTLRGATTRVLLHHEIPLLTFAMYHRDGEGYGGYDFVDAPDIASAFGEAFVPVPKHVLEKPIDIRALERAVGKSKDINYWNPKRIGDILYNFWD